MATKARMPGTRNALRDTMEVVAKLEEIVEGGKLPQSLHIICRDFVAAVDANIMHGEISQAEKDGESYGRGHPDDR